MKAATERKIIRWIHIIRQHTYHWLYLRAGKEFSTRSERYSMGAFSAYCIIRSLVVEGSLGKKMDKKKKRCGYCPESAAATLSRNFWEPTRLSAGQHGQQII